MVPGQGMGQSGNPTPWDDEEGLPVSEVSLTGEVQGQRQGKERPLPTSTIPISFCHLSEILIFPGPHP